MLFADAWVVAAVVIDFSVIAYANVIVGGDCYWSLLPLVAVFVSCRLMLPVDAAGDCCR